MTNYEDFLQLPPFGLNHRQKEEIFTQRLGDLTRRHYDHCPVYRRILDGLGFNPTKAHSPADLPFLPVSLFKDIDLISVKPEEIVTTITSSGTSGQTVSKIYLDKNTAANQQKTLVKIFSAFTGKSRWPMLIIDCPSVLKDRNTFSARGAGLRGFSIFGTDRTYALDDQMNLNLKNIDTFLQKHQGHDILMFGFTFMVWRYFYQELLRNERRIDLSNGLLIHGGGWKTLVEGAVSPKQFKKALKDLTGLEHVYDYYGMAEQTGSLYFECEHGYLHASTFSDVIVRNYQNFDPCDFGRPGVIQVLSLLPESYPGHSLLTEDEGVIWGEDDCACGRMGKYFQIKGRIKSAELRGCSDTHAADVQ